MTNRLEAAIAAVSQLSELEQDAIAALILERLRSTGHLTMSSSQAAKYQPTIASNSLIGLFADEPDLMEQVMQSIGRDREYYHRQSLG